MESDEEIGNAFAIPDLWKSSKFAESALDDPNLISVRLDKFGNASRRVVKGGNG